MVDSLCLSLLISLADQNFKNRLVQVLVWLAFVLHMWKPPRYVFKIQILSVGRGVFSSSCVGNFSPSDP